jgi:hypothetical protein
VVLDWVVSAAQVTFTTIPASTNAPAQAKNLEKIID